MAEKEDVITGKQNGKYLYTYVYCVAKRDSITVMEACQQIRKPRTDKNIARSKAFELALKQVQQTFKFLYIDADATASAESASALGVEALTERRRDWTPNAFGTPNSHHPPMLMMFFCAKLHVSRQRHVLTL